MSNPSREELLWFFDYDKERGILIWKNHWRKSTASRFIGEIAGRKTKDGYINIKLQSKMFKVHRLIWFIETGEWPEIVDHKNGNVTDNRFLNLRDVTNRVNCSNAYFHREGKMVGCTWAKDKGRWKSQIKILKKTYFLGYHDTEQEAHERYLSALKGLPQCHR